MNIPEIEIIRKIDIKQRQLRSLRDFILYVIEVRKTESNKEIGTNLEPFFWPNVGRVLDKRKKNGLNEFLFGKRAEEIDDENTTIQLEQMQNQIQIPIKEISLLKNQFSHSEKYTKLDI